MGKLLIAAELERRQLITAELERRRQLTFRASLRTLLVQTSSKIRGRLPLKKTLRWALGRRKKATVRPKGALIRQQQRFKGL